jgi:hypothetical protein
MSGIGRTESDAPDARSQRLESTMLLHKPEDWPALFVQHLNLLANPRFAINSNDTNFVFDTNVNF